MIIVVSEDGYIVTWESMVTGTRKSATIVQLIEAFEAEPNSCEYWDSESCFCALHRPASTSISTDGMDGGENED